MLVEIHNTCSKNRKVYQTQSDLKISYHVFICEIVTVQQNLNNIKSPWKLKQGKTSLVYLSLIVLYVFSKCIIRADMLYKKKDLWHRKISVTQLLALSKSTYNTRSVHCKFNGITINFDRTQHSIYQIQNFIISIIASESMQGVTMLSYIININTDWI